MADENQTFFNPNSIQNAAESRSAASEELAKRQKTVAGLASIANRKRMNESAAAPPQRRPDATPKKRMTLAEALCAQGVRPSPKSPSPPRKVDAPRSGASIAAAAMARMRKG